MKPTQLLLIGTRHAAMIYLFLHIPESTNLSKTETNLKDEWHEYIYLLKSQ